MQRRFQRFAIPAGYRLSDRVVIVGHAEDTKRLIPQIGEIGVEENPATVFRGIKFHQWGEFAIARLAVNLHVFATAEGNGRGRHVHRHILAAPCFQVPQFGRGDPRGGQNRGAGGADAVTRWQDRVVPGDGDGFPEAAR